MMAFDHCVALPAEREVVRDAVRRTTLWAQRCQASRRRRDQALFGIVQGGLDADLRVTSARDLVGLGFEGYAVGGLSVGESKAEMYAMLDVTVPELPASKPRYLMGVGMPEDLIEGAARGIDLFDCVVPSRHGRTGSLFTSFGRVVIKQARYVRDEQPIDPACGCPGLRALLAGLSASPLSDERDAVVETEYDPQSLVFCRSDGPGAVSDRTRDVTVVPGRILPIPRPGCIGRLSVQTG